MVVSPFLTPQFGERAAGLFDEVSQRFQDGLETVQEAVMPPEQKKKKKQFPALALLIIVGLAVGGFK